MVSFSQHFNRSASDSNVFRISSMKFSVKREPDKGDNDNFCIHLWELWMPHRSAFTLCQTEARQQKCCKDVASDVYLSCSCCPWAAAEKNSSPFLSISGSFGQLQKTSINFWCPCSAKKSNKRSSLATRRWENKSWKTWKDPRPQDFSLTMKNGPFY